MIFLASDHRGFELKEKIKSWLAEWGLQYEDCGAMTLDPEDDYPDFVIKAALKVAEEPTQNRAIILGATGQGEAITANRVKGVRAAVLYNNSPEIVKLSREHNDANVLSIGASFVCDGIQDTIKLWLDTPFSGDERHIRRIAKIDTE